MNATLPQPSHNMTLWQAARWADRKGLLHTPDGFYAVYSTAWTGGEHKAVSGMVFCLGGYEKCKGFAKAQEESGNPLDLVCVELGEVAIQMDLEENEIPERDYRCEAWAH